jgi:hypothetical protein
VTKRRKPLDLGAIRDAKQQLERISEQNPELLPPELLATGKRHLYRIAQSETPMAAMKNFLTLRTDPSLLKRLDAHADRLNAATPGSTFTRADAARILLLEGLTRAEKRGHR